jgi:hypothetical protein
MGVGRKWTDPHYTATVESVLAGLDFAKSPASQRLEENDMDLQHPRSVERTVRGCNAGSTPS